MSLVQQSASFDEQRMYIYDSVHLLSLLYIRMGQVDRARSECEKVLQARRRLLGKRSDASLESTALMAHIYVLLNNRARAKSCLAIIPEPRRNAVLKIVEEFLGMKEEHLDSSSLLARSISDDSDLAVKRMQSRLSASSLGRLLENRCYGPVPAMISQLPVAGLRQSHQSIPSNKAVFEDLHSVTVASLFSAEETSESGATEKERANEATEKEIADVDYSSYTEALGPAAPSPDEPPEADGTFKDKTLSRKEILDRIGCRPKDGIEDAVCEGDHLALANLLNSKNDFGGQSCASASAQNA